MVDKENKYMEVRNVIEGSRRGKQIDVFLSMS